MGKEKKEKRKSEALENSVNESNDSKEAWAEKIKFLSPISQPLAPRKLTKRLYKAVRKAQKEKQLRKGIREVQKFIRKGEKGIVVLAGDVSPLDIISHMPVVCEEKDIPYCYVPSKQDLGSALGGNKSSCILMIKQHEDYKELYNECYTEIKDLPIPI
ncbi:hypothetical protein FSP39_016645 [Pinctada imbricata]|uniref:H/ACA ribonucleoprotein complex subunit 2 n=1 Tax=Pinctada imbricata TaxID=66713 RepID=A0AA89BV12_PINIB|nr:hypothetical protein FSP39_016645 [Pinctada imbricata]